MKKFNLRFFFRSWFSLFFYFFRAVIFFPYYLLLDCTDYFYTVFKFYRRNRLWWADLSLLFSYIFINPYKACKNFLEPFPSDLVQKVYGETFFSTLEKMANFTGLSEKDVVYELGAGRGRGCFWFRCVIGCRTIGIELNPMFVYKAQQVAKKMRWDRFEFRMINIVEVDYADATFIYLYGSCFEQEAMLNIIKALQTCKVDTWLITVTNPLSDYTETSGFELVHSMPARYLWGYTGVYFHRRVAEPLEKN